MNTRSDNLLIIFMKAPRSGMVKTRMQPQLTPAQSLSLYKGMGTDLLHNLLHSSDYELEVHYYPEDGHKEMQEWLGDEVKYFPQEGSNLGEKMRKAISGGIDKGYRRTIIIGSDLPSLSKQDISFAFEQLDMVDLVLGPTVDGGYYLIGAKQDHPQIFEGIPWSSSEVLSQTLSRISSSGLTVYQLPVKSDIDTFEEVRELWLQFQQTPNLTHQLPHTFQALKKIFSVMDERKR